MRSSLVVAALSGVVAACSADGSTHIGDQCPANHVCDSGQICDQTDPGGKPLCIDAKGDLDGDGIPNGLDFCEHMAGGAFDEDGDGIGDDCDRCPIKKPPASADPDGDAVDAPCDPAPGMPGERIVLFNGFNGPPPPGWTVPPNFQIVGGEAVMSSTDGIAHQLTIPISGASSHMVLFTSYRVDAIDLANDEAAVVGSNIIPMGPIEVVCGGLRQQGIDQLELNTDAGDHAKNFTNLFGAANRYELTEQLDGTTANCAVVNAAESGALTANRTDTQIDHVGLRARGPLIRFQYILVVAH